jgi:hypothetical protein
VCYHLHQAHHGDARGIHHRANARALHPWPRASEKLESGITPAERLHQTRGVKVARGFAGGDQNFLGHYYLV